MTHVDTKRTGCRVDAASVARGEQARHTHCEPGRVSVHTGTRRSCHEARQTAKVIGFSQLKRWFLLHVRQIGFPPTLTKLRVVSVFGTALFLSRCTNRTEARTTCLRTTRLYCIPNIGVSSLRVNLQLFQAKRNPAAESTAQNSWFQVCFRSEKKSCILHCNENDKRGTHHKVTRAQPDTKPSVVMLFELDETVSSQTSKDEEAVSAEHTIILIFPARTRTSLERVQ